MTKIYFIDGMKVDLDSSEWNLIYQDGTWSDTGENLFWRKKDDKFILEEWSKWQGEQNTVSPMEREDVITFLTEQEHHPQRAYEALEKIGAEDLIDEF